VTLRYRGHIGWTSSKVITRIISVGSSLLRATYNIGNLVQGEHPKIRLVSLFSAKNLQYFWNGARYDQGYYWWPMGSHIRAFDGAKINDLGWPWRTITQSVSELTTKIWIKIDLYFQRRRCSLMTSFWQCKVYADIRVFGTLRNEAKIITWHYLVPCRLSTDPKIHDVEWPWMAILR